jgi:hypothetical protein
LYAFRRCEGATEPRNSIHSAMKKVGCQIHRVSNVCIIATPRLEGGHRGSVRRAGSHAPERVCPRRRRGLRYSRINSWIPIFNRLIPRMTSCWTSSGSC